MIASVVPTLLITACANQHGWGGLLQGENEPGRYICGVCMVGENELYAAMVRVNDREVINEARFKVPAGPSSEPMMFRANVSATLADGRKVLSPGSIEKPVSDAGCADWMFDHICEYLRIVQGCETIDDIPF